MSASILNPRTADAITEAWKIIRPTCRNDRSAVKKVTDHINKEKLTLRRVSFGTVATYTSRMKLREPFKRSKVVATNGHDTTKELPQIDVLREILLLIEKINQLSPTARQLIKECIQ
jgi:hypothetical protein